MRQVIRDLSNTPAMTFAMVVFALTWGIVVAIPGIALPDEYQLSLP